jgi:tRNA pseudouridine55 synthase
VATSAPADVHGVLVLDKTSGPTSHDAVAVARRALGTRQVGHTGTLDPMATGALVLVIGEATKLVNVLAGQSKAYRASLQLGVATTTLDAEGEPVETRPVPALSLAQVELAAQRFHGEIEQRAPLVSAIKVGGKSLHKRARAGEAVEPPLRKVRVDALRVLCVDGARIDLELECGKGFYVRALARDLAEALGTVGHLSALRRTRNGMFAAAGALDFAAVRQAARGTEHDREQVRARVLPLVDVCRMLPHALLDAAGSEHARQGRPVPLASLYAANPHEAAERGQPPALRAAAAFAPNSADERRPPAEGESLIALGPALEPIAIVERSGDALRVLRGFRGV